MSPPTTTKKNKKKTNTYCLDTLKMRKKIEKTNNL